MSGDDEVLARIRALVDEEHTLRQREQSGRAAREDARDRLAEVEVALDQCWDLLRQRQALRDSGRDPGQARVRPGEQVEGYLG